MLLINCGIYTLEDLISYFPRNYEDRSKPKLISEIMDGEEALIEGICISKMSEIRIRKNMTIYKMLVRDESATCQITWFNMPYLKTKFRMGEKYKFFGKIKRKGTMLEMASPVFEEVSASKNTGKIIPIYPTIYELSQNVLRQIIENGLKESDLKLEETLPEYLLKEYNLEDINTAIKNIHFPENFEKYNLARQRLVFEELLVMQLALLNLKSNYSKEKQGISFSKDVKMSDVINTLPFKLTNAQIKVLEEIDKDMENSKPMNRLLQGDVGSGKTAVAIISAYKAVKSRISSSSNGANSNFSSSTFTKL